MDIGPMMKPSPSIIIPKQCFVNIVTQWCFASSGLKIHEFKWRPSSTMSRILSEFTNSERIIDNGVFRRRMLFVGTGTTLELGSTKAIFFLGAINGSS